MKLAVIGLVNLQIKINLTKRLLECCNINNIGKNVRYDRLYKYRKGSAEWKEEKFGLYFINKKKE